VTPPLLEGKIPEDGEAMALVNLGSLSCKCVLPQNASFVSVVHCGEELNNYISPLCKKDACIVEV